MRSVEIPIKFNKPFDDVPKVKVIHPKGTSVSNVTRTGFNLTIKLDPHNSNPTKLIYQAGNTTFTGFLNPPQFCPACRTQLDKWLSVVPVCMGRDGKPTPVFPISVCSKCGCVFVAKKVLRDVNKIGTQRIVVPRGVTLN